MRVPRSVLRFRKLDVLLLLAGRLLGTGLLIVGLVFAVRHATHSSQGAELFGIRDVRFEGTRNFASQKLRSYMIETYTGNILRVDLEELKELAESESWVLTATVRRQLPGRLIVSIRERVPVAIAAIDQDLYIVDEEGIVLDRYGSSQVQLDGPILKGLGNIARENASATRLNLRKMGIYSELMSDLNSSEGDYTGAISEVLLADPDRIAIVRGEDPVPIYLGSGRFRERYENFLAQKEIYQQLKKEYGRIEYIDVSFDNKIIFHTPGESRERST